MNPMKKLLCAILAIALMLGLSACSWEQDEPPVNDNPVNEQPAEQPSQPDPEPADPEPVVDPQPETQIQLTPAELSEEEQRIIDLSAASRSLAIYDFTADEQLQKITAYAYQLADDGTWHRISAAGVTFNEPQGRLSIAFDLIGETVSLSVQGEQDTSRARHQRDNADDLSAQLDEEQLITVTEQRDEAAEIVYDEEIPMAIQGMSSDSAIASLSLDDYDNIPALLADGYQQAYALTLVFSAQE